MNILKKRILIGFAAMLLVFSQTSLFVYGQSETEDSTKGENTSVTQSEKELAELSLLEQAAQYGQSNGQTAKIIGVDEPFIIGSAEALAELSELILDHAEYGEDMNFAQAKYKLVADIDLSGIGNWIPIGKYTGPTYTAPFEGHFDGNGHVIRNMTIQSMDDNDIQIYAGLFGVMGENGTIENIVLENVNVDGREYLGGLVGYNMGTINNVSVTGNVTGIYYVGGLAGYSRGSVNQSYATGNVKGTENNIGGLVGINNGTICESYSSSNVTGCYYVGGLAGKNILSIRDSYATGDVLGRGTRIGGLVGASEGEINNSYATGNVAGISHVGGLAGSFSGSDNFVHCAALNSSVSGNSYVGKVIGKLIGEHTDHNIGNLYSWSNMIVLGSGGENGIAIDYDSTSGFQVNGTDIDWNQIFDSSADHIWQGMEGNYIPILKNNISTIQSDHIPGHITGSSLLEFSIPEYVKNGNTQTENVLYINNLSDFTSFRDDVNSGNDYTGKTAILNSDIDLSSISNWIPIGIDDNKFNGTFDGNGYMIQNMTIHSDIYDDVGLFGWIDTNGVIKNVGLENVSIIEGGRDVGGLAGTNQGTIDNSYVTGNVSGDWYVGGLVGTNKSGTINKSYASVNVEGTRNAIGGLVGTNYEGTISNSYATGNVLAYNHYTGGLIGDDFKGTITNSYATGNVTGNHYTGGLIGESRGGNIQNSYATGNVKPSEDGLGEYTGGLIGALSDDYDGIMGSIKNSYATGNVSGEYGVGGLAGVCYNTKIANSYATGAVVGISDGIGGLVGGIDSGIIYNNYATGSVTGITNNVGGLVGVNSDSIIYNGVALNSSISGKDNVGKVIGNNENSSIINCYSWNNTRMSLSTMGEDGIGIDYDNTNGFQVDGTNIDWNEMFDDSIDNAWINMEGNHIPILKDIISTQSSDIPNHIKKDDKQTANVIYINHLEDFKKFRDSVNSPSDPNHYDGKTVILSNDIDLSSISSWEPIGNHVYQFKGTFDGNGHVIKNMTIEGNDKYVGLFGYVDLEGTIKNVALENVNITGKSFVGGLVGVNYGAIFNTSVTGSIKATENSVGGLVGYHCGTIHNSHTTIAVKGEENDVGGLVGKNAGTIFHSSASGSVTGTGLWQVGGLVGNNGAKISSSYSSARVKGGSSVGGLVGYNYDTIMFSYAEGTVTGTNDEIGGLVGANHGTISHSYAAGDVTGEDTFIGGLVGINEEKINNSYAIGSVTGGTYVGGIAGEMSDSGSIQHSAALNPSVSGNSYVGRVVGHNNGSVMDCYGYNHMTVTQNGSDSGENGTDISYDAKNGFSVDWKTIFNDTASDFWENMDHKHIPTLIGTNSTQSGDIPEHIKHNGETDAAANI